MTKRLIGVDLDVNAVRVVILNRENKNRVHIEALLHRDVSGLDQQITWLRDILGEARPGDRMALGLPASSAYVRWLEFPFHNRRKIAAVLGYELAAQLPVPVEHCVTAMFSAGTRAGNARICAAALPEQILTDLTAGFDQAGLSLTQVDLAPFHAPEILGAQHPQAYLLLVTDLAFVLSRVEERQVVDFRILARPADAEDSILARAVARDLRAMQTATSHSWPLLMAGPGATGALAAALQPFAERVELLNPELGGKRIGADFLSAAALALRAGRTDASGSFNFRQGAHTFRGEGAGLRRSMLAGGLLLGATLVLTAASLILTYLDHSQRARALRQELTELYQQTFPEAQTVVDVPLQLQSALRALRDRHSLLAQNSGVGPLDGLHVISTLTDSVAFEIEEYHQSPELIRLTGRTPSFETVNRMVSELEKSALFSAVRVIDAKLSLDSQQVDFRLELTLATSEARS